MRELIKDTKGSLWHLSLTSDWSLSVNVSQYSVPYPLVWFIDPQLTSWWPHFPPRLLSWAGIDGNSSLAALLEDCSCCCCSIVQHLGLKHIPSAQVEQKSPGSSAYPFCRRKQIAAGCWCIADSVVKRIIKNSKMY